MERPSCDEFERARLGDVQPIGRLWAYGSAKALALALVPSKVRPNHLTGLSGLAMLGAALLVANGGPGPVVALLLGLGLVLDTADGQLARRQGTSSDLGRWLDATLDEVADMALHAAIAWGAFVRDGAPGWLAVGMAYAMGKYLFVVQQREAPNSGGGGGAPPRGARGLTVLLGNADVRWHLWIGLAIVGRLDWALLAYAAYFPARALLGMTRKAIGHG